MLGSGFTNTAPPPGSAENVDAMQLYRMVNPQIVVEYEFKPLQGDAYEQHGFTGIERKTARVYTSKATMAADFEFQGS